MKAQLYIDGERVELFQDELITVNSSVANIQDISKVFSDYSQTFNVPATPSNNRIFEHWYQTDVLPNIDSRLRRDAFIEVQLIPFRYGKIELNEAVIRGGRVVSYSLTFYGSLTSLKDRFGEFTLKDLNYSSIAHTYSGTDVYNRVTDGTTAYDVRYPLIAPRRLWTFGDSGANDITTNSGSIKWDELFPAIRVAKIFEIIETQFGITFNSNFFALARWTDLYIRFQNADSFVFMGESLLADISTNALIGTWTPLPTFNTTTDEITIPYQPFSTPTFSTSIETFNVGSTTIAIYCDVFLNDVFFGTVFCLNNAVSIGVDLPNEVGNDINVKFFFRATEIETFDYQIKILQGAKEIVVDGAMTTTVNVNLSLMAPPMKIYDFVSAIFRAFNLVCEGVNETSFIVEPLQDWYALGEEKDITKYVVNSSNVNRLPLYKQIAFKYKESKCYLNRNFVALFNREYGNLDYSFIYDGGEFKIDLPFENLQFFEFPTTNLFASFLLDEQTTPYVPEPILLYLNGEVTATQFKFFDGSSHLNVTDYALFSQTNTTGFSLNFGNEFDIVTQQTEPNSLYNTYYANPLSNLYDIQQRMFSFTAFLPTGLMTKLRMNDKLIIHDRRYLINDISTTLNNGEVKMNLLRELVPFEPNCDCIKITYQLVGEEPVTVEVEQDRSGSFLPFYIDNPPTPITGIWISFIDNEWVISSGMSSPITTQATLSENTPCPFGTYTIEEGSIFESFIVEPCY